MNINDREKDLSGELYDDNIVIELLYLPAIVLYILVL